MSQVVLPPTLTSATLQSAGPVGVPGTITSPPPDLARQPPGHVLKGVALGRDGHGHLLVKTEVGVLAVATKANPPPGSEVTLQIRSNGPQLHVVLLRIDSPAHPGESAQRSLAMPPGGGPALPAGDRLTVRQQIVTQLVSPPNQAQLAEAGRGLPPSVLRALPLLASQSLIFTLVAIEQPPGAPAPLPEAESAAAARAQSSAPTANSTLPATAPARRSDAPASPGQAVMAGQATSRLPGSVGAAPNAIPPAPAPTGAPGPPGSPSNSIAPEAPSSRAPSPIPVSVGEGTRTATPANLARYGTPLAASRQPPAAGPTPVTTPADSATRAPALSVSPDGMTLRIVAEVENHTADARPIATTPVGRLALTNVGMLARGTALFLELPLAALSLPAEPAGTLQGAKNWSRLAEMLQAAGHRGPADLHPLLRALPQPGARLASDLLFLISALRGGELTVWPGGQALEELEHAGRGELIPRLGADLAQAARSADGAPGDWRLLALPFHDGSQLQQLRLYLRRDRATRRGAVEKATRFVLEVDLTRVGALQLDGLVQPRRFDLMLRSRQPLSEQWRQDIAHIFEEANAAVGNAGEIVFQASSDWRSLSTAATAATIQGGLVV